MESNGPEADGTADRATVGHSPLVVSISRTSVAAPEIAPAVWEELGAPPAPFSPSVKAWTKGTIVAPAPATSRLMRSMATRMFCWRSVISGSRRKAFWPPVSSPKMAPLTINVMTMATSSSTMLNPDCRGSTVVMLLLHAVRPQGAHGHPRTGVVQVRNVVNSARERARARTPVPSDLTRMNLVRPSTFVIVQRLAIVPTPRIWS